MSIYTKYDVRIKENLSRIRTPGDVANDGICPERVIFRNDGNIYYGVFKGTINSEGQTFDNCTINGGSINGTVINDALFKYGNLSISLEDLTSNISEISGNLDSVMLETIPDIYSKLSASATSDTLSALSTLLLCTIWQNDNNLCAYADDISSIISNEISPNISNLEESCLVAAQNIQYLSSQISNAISAIDDIELALSTEISTRISADEMLLSNDQQILGQISSLSNDVDEIWKNIRGGLNFMGVVSCDSRYPSDTVSAFLATNFRDIYNISLSDAQSMKVRQGFFYPVHAEDQLSHYNIGGLIVEHGDWLIAKQNFVVSDAVPSVLAVFDAQDQDVANTHSNNTFEATNTFNGKTIFNGLVEVNNTLSSKLSNFIYDEDGTSLQDLSNDVYNKISQADYDISAISNIIDAKSYLGSVNTEAVYVPTLPSWFMQISGIGPETMLYKGAFARSNVKFDSISSSTSSDAGFIGVNDYLIINKNIVVSDIGWSDVDVIRDPKNETVAISSELSTLSVKVDRVEDSLSSLSTQIAQNDEYLSGQISSLSILTLSNDEFLSTSIDNKIFIDGISAESLSAIHISKEEFEQKVIASAILSNELYVVSSEFIDAYGEQIKNLAEPELSDDAATKSYVDVSCITLCSQIYEKINDISNDLTANDEYLSSQISSLSNDMISSDEYLSSQISSLSNDMISSDEFLSTSIDNKIFIDGISAKSLSAIHISQDDFYQLVVTSATISNELYVVSSDYINAYGEQIKNLSAPTDLSDAATKGYVDDISSNISININNISSNLQAEISGLTQQLYCNLSSITTDDIISGLQQKSCISNVISAVVGIKNTLITLVEALSGILNK